MNQGVQYHGHGGLREKLENLALLDGLPNNAYLTGEGLVEKAGTKIFSNSIRRISNTLEEADKIYSEITPYLREGLILSFSTTFFHRQYFLGVSPFFRSIEPSMTSVE